MICSSGVAALGGSTRCRLDIQRSPVQRASMSPILIVDESGTEGAST
jgi:hypothetical protein